MRGPDTLRISVLVPVDDAAPDILEATIRSVVMQTSPDWELCLYDDASPNPEIRDVLGDHRGTDARIKVVQGRETLSFAAAAAAAAEFATGRFVAVLRHDHRLRGHAVATLLRMIAAHPGANVFLAGPETSDGPIRNLTVMRKRLFFALGTDRIVPNDHASRTAASPSGVIRVPGLLDSAFRTMPELTGPCL